MPFTKVAPAGIGTEPGSSIRIGDSLLHSTGIDIGTGSGIGVTIRQHGDATFTGIVTAQKFVGDGTSLSGIDASSLKHNNNTKAQATATGVDFTGNVSVSGNMGVAGVLTYEDVTNIDSVGIITARAGIHNTGGNITLGDSSGTNDDRIKLGDSGDLQIYHSGSHSIIADFSGTGQLQICTDAFRLNNAANNENIIAADQDGSVSLYENNSLKFKTGVTGDYGSVQLQNGKRVGMVLVVMVRQCLCQMEMI